jgi:ABC-type multidrug transport system ATPase subunit
MIRVDRITAAYGMTKVLRDVSVEVGAGDCLRLIGAPRSGKTTLLRVLAGLLEPRAGSIRLRGERRGADPVRLRRAVSYAASDALAGDGLRVDEYLRFVAYVRSARATRDRLMPTVPQRVGLDPATPVAALTREGRAALAVAAAMVASCDIILIDDVIDAMAPVQRLRVTSWLAEVRDRGAALIIASNDDAICNRLCQRMARLDCGRLVELPSSPRDVDDRLRATATVVH